MSLPEGGDQQTLSNGTLSEIKSVVSQGNSTFSRILNGPSVSGGGVVLQSSTGNIFHLPSSSVTMTQDSSGQHQAITAASIKQGLKQQQQQVLVRPAGGVSSAPGGSQTNSVLVQMPAGSVGNQTPIRIVRSLPVHHTTQHQQLNSANTLIHGGLTGQVKTVAGPIPSPQGGPATPQTPGVPSPAASVTSPGGGMMTPESPLYVQLQAAANHGGVVATGGSGGDQPQQHFVQLNQKQVNLVNQGGGVAVGGAPTLALGGAPNPAQLINNQSLMNQTHLKIRPQRKQSLK